MFCEKQHIDYYTNKIEILKLTTHFVWCVKYTCHCVEESRLLTSQLKHKQGSCCVKRFSFYKSVLKLISFVFLTQNYCTYFSGFILMYGGQSNKIPFQYHRISIE